MATDLRPIGSITSDLYRGAVPVGLRHPSSRRSLSPSSRHHPSFVEIAGVAVAGIAGTLLVVIATLLLLYAMRAGSASTAGSDTPGFVDVPVDRVVTDLPDGRHALVSVTLRMRDDAVPANLAAVAAYTPTPPTRDPRADRAAALYQPSTEEAILREQITNVVAATSYEKAATQAGKERLRVSVRAAVNAALPGEPVTDVYLREYLVQ